MIENKQSCMDYINCIQQTGSHVGFVPLTTLQLYTGIEKKYQKIPDILPLQSVTENHKSALQFPSEIQKYIDEELQHGAILGPFVQYPFPTHVSPLMTRSKQNSNKRRTIMDLSGPLNCSVNHGVKKHIYLNTYFQLQYPSIDNITHALNLLGPGAILYKVDISRAFRHIRVDPGDTNFFFFLIIFIHATNIPPLHMKKKRQNHPGRKGGLTKFNIKFIGNNIKVDCHMLCITNNTFNKGLRNL